MIYRINDSLRISLWLIHLTQIAIHLNNDYLRKKMHLLWIITRRWLNVAVTAHDVSPNVKPAYLLFWILNRGVFFLRNPISVARLIRQKQKLKWQVLIEKSGLLTRLIGVAFSPAWLSPMVLI